MSAMDHSSQSEAVASAALSVILEVDASMTGAPQGDVLAELCARLRAAGLSPNKTLLRSYAEAISGGGLEL